MIYPSYEYESALKSKGFDYICGVDEVGRGTLAGPVMSAAVIIPSEPPKEYAPFIRDSKTLTKQKRSDEIRYTIAVMTPIELNHKKREYAQAETLHFGT